MKSFIVITLLLTTSIQTFSQSIDTVKIDHYLDSLYQERAFNGQIYITQGNKIIMNKSYGYADYQSKLLFTDSTRFQIASISKHFTATAILLLQQRGLLNINSTFSKYYPQFPYKDITLRQMLAHTSGLPIFYPNMTNDLDHSKVNGNKIMYELLLADIYPAEFKPGEKWSYSNISYCLLASLIEKITGQSYDNFMAENLFKPAGMTHTTAELTTDIRQIKGGNIATGYHYNKFTKKYIRAEEVNEYVYWLGGFYGDGSIVTCVKDLDKWKKAYLSEKILSSKYLKLQATPQITNSGEKAVGWGYEYALGWFNVPKGLGYSQSSLQHSGNHPGYHSRFTIDKENDLVVILFCNQQLDEFWKIRPMIR